MRSSSSPKALAKPTPVTIAVFDQTMQSVNLSPRSRSSTPATALSNARRVAPVVAGAPQALRGVLGSNQVCHGFPLDRHCEPEQTIGDRTMRLVSMDNGRYRLLLCPELGGRILSLVDRQAGGELLFQPPMILGRSIGLAGAWHVGGIEVNAFRYGHLLLGRSCLKTSSLRLASGFDAVQFEGFDERAGCSFTCVLALLPDRLAMRITLTNHSSQPQSGYYWTNIAVPANPWTHLHYPPGPMLNHGQGRPGYADSVWPMIEGFDCRRWQMHPEIMSAYSYAPKGDWMGNCDRRSGLTFAHRALRADHAGKKLWSLGSGSQDRVWFDHGVGEPGMGSYVEIQSGRMCTQTHADLLAPGSTISWTEECVGVVSHPTDGDATSEYADFVATTEATLDSRWAVRDTAFWEPVGPVRELVAADKRMSLSERMVTGSQPVTDLELKQSAKQGWVAGERWIAALDALNASGKGTPWTELGAAVAASDLSAKADVRLQALSRRSDVVGAWASYVRALYEGAQKAIPLLRRAVSLAPRERVISLVYAQQLLASGDILAAQKIAKSKALRGTEDARGILAESTFLSQKWQACRDILAAPFLSQGEGQFRLWAIRKEVDIIEAFQSYRKDGDIERALVLLHEASRMRPQFGLGRDEYAQSADVLFYRWALLALSGRTESAALAAHQLLLYPSALSQNSIGTSVGAYALRLAVHVKSPCAKGRIAECLAWANDAANDPRPLASGSNMFSKKMPWYEGGIDVTVEVARIQDELKLRRCVLRAAAGRPAPFADLRKNSLYGQRAEMEQWLVKKLHAKYPV